MKWNRLGKLFFVSTGWLVATTALGVAGSGCLARKVGQQAPTTKVNFTSTVSQQAVDKVDILFAIDNSASMGDKQSILADAVPDLINGLLKPKCVDGNGVPNGKFADPSGTKENHFGCAPLDPEFKPVTDMHIGIVSSSLGNFGGDVCPTDASNARKNDRGHLVNFKKEGGTVDLATPQGYLAWFPDVADRDAKQHPTPAKPVKDLAGLTAAFKDMVVGVDQTGCGLEAQLESVYRFLVQPDPWDEIKVISDDGNPKKGQADLGDGVDVTVIKQRADFLRPNSLVAVIMLTDEDDSSADPLAVQGQGWAFMSKTFPSSSVPRGASGQGTTAPRGTSICSSDPGAKYDSGPDKGKDKCTSCAFQFICDGSDPACQDIKNDANCKESGLSGKSGLGYDGYYAPTEDDLNVRFHRMKERYGIDPQYPVQRYVDGFTQQRVPDRKAEHKVTEPTPGARWAIEDYGTLVNDNGVDHFHKCTNPLFAATLPTGQADDELCKLPPGTRTADQIFFAIVGGVPNQLLHFTTDKSGNYDPDASRISDDDWTKILGKDPVHYNYDGIDPHMIQSVAPRTAAGLSGQDQPKGSNGTDPIHGREWNTNKGDLQYACTFDLPADKVRTCGPSDSSCDCSPDLTTNPPLCGTTAGQQIKAKAYPTVRELEVAHLLGDQGIVSSLCPIQLSDANAPTYGYRPAVAAIVDRLKNALTTQCLPRKLREPAAAGGAVEPVPCLVLAQLADTSDNCQNHGLKEPAPEILTVFKQQQRAASGNVDVDGGLDLSALPVCVIDQATPTIAPGDSCKADTNLTWCYVENTGGATPAGSRCGQAIILSSGTASLAGARFSLQCIQQAGGDTTK